MKRRIIICLLVFITLLGTSSCRELTQQEIWARNVARWERLPEKTRHDHIKKTDFAAVFWFDYEDRILANRGFFLRAVRRSGKRNVAFVASREEAAAGDESTFYFWPRTVQREGRPTDITNHVLYVLNHILYEEFDGWDTVSFSYPITIEELLEHWEEIWDLCIELNIVFLPGGWNRLVQPNSYNELREQESAESD